MPYREEPGLDYTTSGDHSLLDVMTPDAFYYENLISLPKTAREETGWDLLIKRKGLSKQAEPPLLMPVSMWA